MALEPEFVNFAWQRSGDSKNVPQGQGDGGERGTRERQHQGFCTQFQKSSFASLAGCIIFLSDKTSAERILQG